jgi:hypothetical protein
VRQVLPPSRGPRAPPVAMAPSQAQSAKRAFVKTLVALAAALGVAAGVTRDSPDPDVFAAGHRVAQRLRAAAGGDANNPDEKRLDSLRAAWDLARETPGKAGRRPSGGVRAAAGSAGGEDVGTEMGPCLRRGEGLVFLVL